MFVPSVVAVALLFGNVQPCLSKVLVGGRGPSQRDLGSLVIKYGLEPPDGTTLCRHFVLLRGGHGYQKQANLKSEDEKKKLEGAMGNNSCFSGKNGRIGVESGKGIWWWRRKSLRWLSLKLYILRSAVEGTRNDVLRGLSTLFEICRSCGEMEGLSLQLLVLLTLTLATCGVSIVFSFLGARFWDSLSSNEPEGFSRLLGLFGVAMAVGAPVVALQDYAKDRVALRWRDHLTRRIIHGYLQSGAYYTIEMGKDIDNPDQRITVSDLTT
ncbi:unnamed protein product [Choristocarpus tenellus]